AFGGEVDGGGRVRRIRQVLYSADGATLAVNLNRHGIPVMVRTNDGTQLAVRRSRNGSFQLKPRGGRVARASGRSPAAAGVVVSDVEDTKCATATLGFNIAVGATRDQIRNGFRDGGDIGGNVVGIVDNGLCTVEKIVRAVYQ